MLVRPMYSKEIYKQLELIKEVLALHALDSSYPRARECSIEALEKKVKMMGPFGPMHSYQCKRCVK